MTNSHRRDPYRFKVIADSVHKEIALSELETRLVSTRSFQRLRHLKQLGLAHLVYPGATHTRFAHSLGVFHIMSRAIDLMVDKGLATDEERKLLRVAALLHDIGHYPYSHLVEYLDRDPTRAELLGNGKRIRSKEPYPSHEKLAQIIIEQGVEINEASDGEFDPKEVAAIIRGEHSQARFNQLVHSTLDLDRMDYLVRDSIGTGVPFGQVDINYLLSNLGINDDGSVVLSHKASIAAEHFVVARYFMSKTIYLHKTVFGFEALLRQILFLLRQKGKLWKNGTVIEKLIAHPKKIIDFRDSFIDSLVITTADNEAGKSVLGKLCRALRDRRPPTLLAELASLTPEDGQPSEQFTRFKARRNDQLTALAKNTKIPLECWLSEDPKDVLFERMGPFISLAQASNHSPDHEMELIKVLDRDGKTKPLVEDPSSIIHHLAKLRPQMARLYVVEESETKIQKAKREIKKWLDP